MFLLHLLQEMIASASVRGKQLFIVRSQEQVQEVIFQEYFKHVLLQLLAFLISLLQLHVVVDSLDALNRDDREGHERFPCCQLRTGFISEISHCFPSHLHPSINKDTVETWFVLLELTLKEDWVIRVY